MPTIAFLPGDGIGPEICAEARLLLVDVNRRTGTAFELVERPIGGASIDAHGVPMTEETLATCLSADAVLLGAVGGPKWDELPLDRRPEKALLRLRKELDCFANLRPVRVWPQLSEGCPLRADIVAEGIDILFVRELVSGIYFGSPRERRPHPSGFEAIDTMYYNTGEIVRTAEIAFAAARGRRQRVTSIDKSNVLETSRLWRETVTEVGRKHPDIALDHQLVDSAAMRLITHPSRFDVVVTTNMFGDILSDEASVLSGSLGMMPSGTISSKGKNFYEPIHGSAPDIAGKGMANPIATMLSVGMMLEHSFGMVQEHARLVQAVGRVLDEGLRTADIMREGKRRVSTQEMGAAVREKFA